MRRSLILSSCFIAGLALTSGAYIVKKGDTLWDLSAQFLSNPFSWPDLWQKNQHIKDPHWIYPGDSLYLNDDTNASVDTTSKIEEAATMEPSVEPPADTLLPKGVAATAQGGSPEDEFRRNLGNLPGKVSADDAIALDSTRYTYRQTPPPIVFNPHYQIFAPKLFERAKFRADKSWFSLKTGDKKQTLLLHAGDELLLQVGKKGAPLKVGAGVELWTVEPVTFSKGKDTTKQEYALARLSGFAKITAVGDTLTRLTLTRAMAAMDIEKVRAHLTKAITPIKVKSYQNVPEINFETMPRIRYVVDATLIVGAYSYVLVDGGKSANLNPGDGVAFIENKLDDPSLPPRVLGRGIVVASEAKEATILVRELQNPTRPLESGTRVALTHRAMQP